MKFETLFHRYNYCGPGDTMIGLCATSHRRIAGEDGPRTHTGTRPVNIGLTYLVLILTILISCLTTSLSATEIKYIVDTFSDGTNHGNFNHLAVDRNTGRIYVGAVNRLYQLSELLVQEKAITTGPKDDSPNCPPEGQDCVCRTANCDDYLRKPTNSISKALVIDYNAGRLITCTNLFQGHCEKRHLADISQMDDHVFKSIVPNDEISPAIVFIGPGPSKEGLGESEDRLVLYVAATRSTQGLPLYNDLVPNLSSRDLDTFDLAAKDISHGTKIDLEYRQRSNFRVSYVDGFKSGGFSYVVSIQPEKLEVQNSNYISKIIRVCQKDRKFYSFAEVDLQCYHEGKLYNILRGISVAHPGAHLARSLGLSHLPPLTDTEDVLFALFARSDSKSMEPLADSVMCVFPLKEIRRTFTENIQDCFRGVGNTGPAHISVPDVCINTDFAIEDDYCGAYELNNPIAGTKPISANAVVHFENTLVSSVAVTDTHEYTVAFVGTTDGTIKKVVIESASLAHEYETVRIDGGSEIARDMDFDRSESHVYVMSEKKVSMVKVQQCDRFQTCGECLGAQDPYCGWCVLESKCSLKTECTNADDTLRWLPYSNSQCTNITKVIPEQVQRKPNGATELMLHVKNLPSITSGGYFCAFSGYGVVRTTRAEIRGASSIAEETHVHCKTPDDNLLPPIPTGKDHIVMDLSVRMNNKDFVSRNFTFFDCSLHNACTSCTESDFPCTWCVQNHQCTDNQENCLTDILITGQNVKGLSDRPGPQTCPRIEASFTEILVPSGQDKKVTVKALNLQDFQTDFKCNFNIDGGRRVNAVKVLGTDFIECDSITFQYSGSSPHRNVPFEITWGTSEQPLDNPDIIQVKVYKCMSMATDCGGCLTLEPKYNCGWCDSQCTIQQHCTGKTWLDNSQDCPNPVITSFHPTTGPRQGGTRLTIYGNNLGKVFDDVESGITVANIPCAAIRDEYEPAKKVVCVTDYSDSIKTGPVLVSIKSKFSDASDVLFSYVEPRITDFSPKKGPISGGTRITIKGHHMDAGTTVTGSVVGLPCNVTSTSEGSAICITSSNVIASEGLVEMRFDQATVQYNIDKFSYVEDPHIFDIEPDKSILSGGTLITVNGANLDSVQQPLMYVHLSGRPYYSNCTVDSDTLMYCDSPSMSASGLQSRIDPISPLEVSFGFIMDNVTDLKNLTALSNGEKKLTLFPDPLIEPFKDGVHSFQSKKDYLTIEGKNLNLALNKEDYRVLVGLKECAVQWVDANKLPCKPPPPSEDGVGNNPKVTVFAGRNLTFAMGTLKYESALGLDLPIIIAIAGAGGILILIIIIIFIAYKRKSRESDRVMKRMQNQMDTLEAKVAKECKEAFAELQTDMTEITNDLGGTAGIPFRDYRSFTMRVLFPNCAEDDHPVTRPMEVDLTRRDGFDRGLKLFHNLLLNKTFLLLFIRTLESHRDFSMRERVNVASLISVALQNRMEYHTDILKTLLAELIEKSMEGRNHPKLLLRRTESVAEKMLTNWFTFLLFKFLKECAGEPLFMLYRAIKGQVDKGPVDFLTSEAKYSLSEDKLIRQQLDYKTMTIYVIDPDIQFGSQEHAVKVLDCDSVSQVKEKILDAIYKNAPYSSRPIRDDLDLEWRTGVKGRIILQDEDMTTKSEGDYRRLNTLAHYKVPDGSVMALIPRQANMNLAPKQNSLYNLSLGSDKSGSHHRFDMYAMSGSPSLTRSLSPPNIHIDMETGSKYYHLVKPHEENKGEDRGNKMVSEIYLTRLLATKGTLQQYVDDLFETIFSTTNRGCALPLAIKYMFDFLDDQALHHGINDPEVVHTWKSNSLPLRFWINVVKNPDFVFDVHKSNIVDACLSVTAQTFMDSCSMSEHRLGKDSPSSKLLYAKDIPKYKKWVERYYQDVKLMPAISDQDMNSTLNDESRQHSHEFNTNAALYELYHYVIRYNDEFYRQLEEDEFAKKSRLALKLEQVFMCFDSEV